MLPESFKIWIFKVQDFGNFELSPMLLGISSENMSNQVHVQQQIYTLTRTALGQIKNTCV